MDLSQFGINTNGTGGSTSPLAIPGLESLQNTLGNIMLVSVVLGGLFFVMYVISAVQRMRADRAMIEMRKDIAAIKHIIELQATQKINQVPAPTTPQQPLQTP